MLCCSRILTRIFSLFSHYFWLWCCKASFKTSQWDSYTWTPPCLTPIILCFFQRWYETLVCVCVRVCARAHACVCACVIGPDFLLQFPAVRLAAEISWLNGGVRASVGNCSVATIPAASHTDSRESFLDGWDLEAIDLIYQIECVDKNAMAPPVAPSCCLSHPNRGSKFWHKGLRRRPRASWRSAICHSWLTDCKLAGKFHTLPIITSSLSLLKSIGKYLAYCLRQTWANNWGPYVPC